MQNILMRSQQSASPNQILEEILGHDFKLYRKRFLKAEAGLRSDIPLHLDVDVTTVCNLACPMCPAGSTSQHIFPGFGLFMDQKLYQSALSEAQRLKIPSIRLGITGEPLLVPDLDQWVKAAKEAGFIDIALITNGQYLSPSFSRKLLEAGLTKLMISVDAASEETYKKIRPKGDYQRLLENIEAFVTLRKEMKKRLPLLRLSFVEMEQNIFEKNEFEKKFAPIADWLVFQNYLDIMNHQQREPQDPRGLCPDPLTRLSIFANGDLFPCCSDFGRLYPLGHYPQNSLLDIWESEKAKKLTTIKSHLENPCRMCRAASSTS